MEPKIYGYKTKQTIEKLIFDISSNKEKAFRAFLCGQHGTGKSTLLQEALQAHGFNVFQLDISKFHNVDKKENTASKQLERALQDFMSQQSVDFYFFKNTNVLIIDDIDAFQGGEQSLLTKYKAVISDATKKVPVIATYNKKNEKQIYDLIRNKKNQIYMLEPLTPSEQIEVVDDLCKEHGLQRCTCTCEKCTNVNSVHCGLCNSIEPGLTRFQVVSRYLTYNKSHMGNIIANIHGIFKTKYPEKEDTFVGDPFTDMYTTDIAAQILCSPEDYTLEQLEYVNKYDPNMIFYAIHENYPLRVFDERFPSLNPKAKNFMEKLMEVRKGQLSLIKKMSQLFSTADLLEKYNNENMLWDGLGKPCENFYKIGMSKAILCEYPRHQKCFKTTEFTKVLTISAKVHNTFKKHCAFEMVNDIPVGNKEMLGLLMMQIGNGINNDQIDSYGCAKVFNKTNIDMLTQCLSEHSFLSDSKKKCEKVAKKFLKI